MTAAGVSQGRITGSTFKPYRWLRGPHAQTMVPSLLRPLPRLSFELERLELEDGDFVDLAWSGPASATRVAVLVHGLTGGFESKYLRGTALKLNALGWQTVALQLRGGGAEPNRTSRLYNHGDTADLRHLWKLLRERRPQARVAAVGWSLGANVLLKSLHEEGDAAPLAVAVAACAPFELAACAERLRTGSARIYQKKLLDGLKQIVRLRHPRLPVPAGVDLVKTLAARDFFEFDDAYTAPLNGYRDALDYYARCSSRGFLKSIQVPTLIINAIDDPFMTRSMLPQASELSPAVTLELAQRGGHVGFLGADARGRAEFWLERRIAQHLDAAVSA